MMFHTFALLTCIFFMRLGVKTALWFEAIFLCTVESRQTEAVYDYEHSAVTFQRLGNKNLGMKAPYLWLLTSRPWQRYDMFVQAWRDQWHTTKLCLCLSVYHTYTAHTNTPFFFVCTRTGMWVCACVHDKPHWWSNSRLAVFPDWVALDIHTSEAPQVDALALRHCNCLAWLSELWRQDSRIQILCVKTTAGKY